MKPIVFAQTRPAHWRAPIFGRLTTMLGVGIVATALLVAILAPYLTPHDPFAQNLNLRLIPPVWSEGSQPAHPLGTDQLGRDYLSRLIYGTRISLLIGVLTVITSGTIGMALGIIGGFYGGVTDSIVMFLITCRLSIPIILVALTVVALVGSSLAVVILTLGLLLWERFAVVARTTTMQVRNLDYIAAAQAAGASRIHVLTREVLPNIAQHLLVVATLEIALAILLEAALSFLGLGVPPPLPSWGLMIAEAKEYMFFSPWVIMSPGIALFLLVLGINLVGDGLRDTRRPNIRQ
jgi:peptide/nickel transport system permease protein